MECPLGDGIAIYDSRTGAYFALNASAARVWSGARQPSDRSVLLACLTRGVESAAGVEADFVADLDSLLSDLISAGLLVQSGPTPDAPDGFAAVAG